MEDIELKKVLETLLFITDAPLPVSRIAQLCEIKNKERLERALSELRSSYDEEGRTLQIMQVAGGWQLATRPEYGLWVRKLYQNKMTVRLTQAALETLCIIAYKQPLTRAEIEAIRGVEVIGPLETLSQRRLITVVGRRESIGRPILYGTTSEFLRQFGLNSLDDMPKLESFNIENMAAAAQSTAVELVEEESIPEPVAEGAPPPDPAQAALAETGEIEGASAETEEAGPAPEATEEAGAAPAESEEAASATEETEPAELEGQNSPVRAETAEEPAAEAEFSGQASDETGEKPL
ncbi:MAG: SMC-Scp complex subunit ScpB [Elusimicrobia bacterium CG_4_10_14_0_2_um_filter_56_8]|nr:MAG: SMC-Scp complex subunit ScpB [Elusimicrobia bacterium CG1_02_56_21]PJA15444.1 MAG: SMC-Scp complex subunit ScpB [Elusimicrobia bacterium CG_4_10_14_0_2_um_filter_56_8]